MKKSLLLTLILLSLLIGTIHAGEWTVLVYMAADNDLASYAEQNIIEMERATQPEGLNLIVQVDLPNMGGRRYKIEERPATGINSPVLQSLGTIDSGDPDTLKDFISWGFNRYPSQKKMLIIWSHADSWYKNPKYIAPDEDSGNMIGVANGELLDALSDANHLDILLFDACSMQSIEIMYELRNEAAIIIGSADQVPVRGFPYEAIIPVLSGDPEHVAGQIPGLYNDSYQPGGSNNPSMGYLITTCSAVKTDSLTEFYQAWRQFSGDLWGLADQLAPIREKLFEMNSGYADVDIHQFLMRLDEYGVISTSELRAMLSDMILASAYTLPWVETDLVSIALWYPDVRINLDWAWQIYMKLGFAQSGWLSVVNQALGADTTSPLAPQLISERQSLGKLWLTVAAPMDVDSLYYRIFGDHIDMEIFPRAYAAEIHLDFPIDSDGSYEMVAIDRSGNISEALSGSYIFRAALDEMLIYPNPIRVRRIAYAQWYIQGSANQDIKATLYNIRGQKIASKQLVTGADDRGMLKLDEIAGFARLSKGIYILELRFRGRSIRKKLTIMH